jgi:hypothetical protein
MDRSGAMPRSAWVEIRDEGGELLASIPAQIKGGEISAELPGFPPGTRGTVRVCTDEEGSSAEDPEEVKELPTERTIMVVNTG